MRTAEVGQFARETMRTELPAEIEEWSRWALLDTIGVLLAGHETATARAATRSAARTPGEARTSGREVSTTPAMAAFADAVAANALDYEDGHYEGGGIHAGSTVVPVLLAIAPPETTLSELRRAMVVGYEVGIRAGYLLSPDHGHTYRASGHAASLGAAVAAAALLRLPTEQVASALRIAAAHAPVSTMQAAGSCESIGWAAATAVSATFLAIDGFTDERVDSLLSSPVSGSPFDDDAPGQLAESLGTRFESVNCYVKPYACCRLIHAALDALALLLTRRPLRPSEIESVQVSTPASGINLYNRRPVLLEEAQFSIPIAASTFLIHGCIGPAQSTAEVYCSPEVLSLAERVTGGHEPAFDERDQPSYPARVRIDALGRVDSTTVLDALGSVGNPLSKSFRLAKAEECLRVALKPELVEQVKDMLLDPSGQNTVGNLKEAVRRTRRLRDRLGGPLGLESDARLQAISPSTPQPITRPGLNE
jgi:2-methylcitrate dehydratase PrpD